MCAGNFGKKDKFLEIFHKCTWRHFLETQKTPSALTRIKNPEVILLRAQEEENCTVSPVKSLLSKLGLEPSWSYSLAYQVSGDVLAPNSLDHSVLLILISSNIWYLCKDLASSFKLSGHVIICLLKQ